MSDCLSCRLTLLQEAIHLCQMNDSQSLCMSIISKKTGSDPLLVLYGQIGPRLNTDRGKLGLQFVDVSGSLCCSLMTGDTSLIGCTVCVWQWNLLLLPKENDSDQTIHDMNYSGNHTIQKNKHTADMSKYYLEIISVSPWSVHAHVLDRLAEFTFDIPFDTILHPSAAKVYAVDSTLSKTICISSSTGQWQLQGMAIGKSGLEVTKTLAHCFLRMKLSHRIGSTRLPFDNEIVIIMFKGPLLEMVSSTALLRIGNEYSISNLKPQKLTFPKGLSVNVLAFGPLSKITSIRTSIIDLDTQSSCQDSPETSPSSLSGTPKTTLRIDAASHTRLNHPGLYCQIVEGFVQESIRSWRNSMITYTGYITTVLDGSLLFFQLDAMYNLICTFSTLDIPHTSLRPGTQITVVDVHLIFSSATDPVFLVMCDLSKLQVISWGPICANPSSSICFSEKTLSYTRRMSFVDLIYFQLVSRIISQVCSTSDILLPSAMADLGLHYASLAILHICGFIPLKAPAPQVFLCHDQACSILIRQSDYPFFISVEDANNHLEVAVSKIQPKPFDNSILSIKINANDFNSSSLACIGALKVNQTTDHLVLLLDVVLISEIIVTGGEVPSNDKSDSTFLENRPTTYSYIEVRSSNIRDIGSLHAPLLSVGPVKKLGDMPCDQVIMHFLSKRLATLYCNSSGDPELEIIMRCGLSTPKSTTTNDRPFTEVYFRFYGPTLHIPELYSLNHAYLVELPVHSLQTVYHHGASNWDLSWKFREFSSDIHRASFKTMPKLLPIKITLESQSEQASQPMEFLSTVTCRILLKQWQIDKKFSQPTFSATAHRQNTVDLQPYTRSTFNTKACQLAQQLLVGLGREYLKLTLKVETIDSMTRMWVDWDIRNCAFPFGILVGRVVLFENLMIKRSRNNRQYAHILPITTVTLFSDSHLSNYALTADHKVDDENTNFDCKAPCFRISHMLSLPMSLKKTDLFVYVTAITEVSITNICQVCKQMAPKNMCSSNCIASEYSIQAQAEISVEDGTAKAKAMLSEIDSIITLLRLSSSEYQRLEKMVCDAGTVLYTVPKYPDNAVYSDDLDQQQSVATPDSIWLEAIVQRRSNLRQIQMDMTISTNINNNAASESSGFSDGPSLTCVGDMFHLRPYSLSTGSKSTPVKTLSYVWPRLYPVRISDVDSRELALKLLTYVNKSLK
ncbi:hypothetical protein BDEG_28510 [Batrachochytrium dendrobatidis JEL423]|uniref:CST complex subunit CTC1 n=1 Tax=Batrachochytrium dendrobatidis (strain JEL423) TaxID=403673 RepID=A0A177WZH7_BATDL|nr:hypothetical protein BDEG_28510 [Batrachochytrium dendrobatidis JEL423]